MNMTALSAALLLSSQAFSQAKKPAKDTMAALGWYQFRGPNRDGLSPDTGLLKQWPANGPTLAWKTTGLGEGYSSVSISGKYIFTMGQSGGSVNLIALGSADGKKLWSVKVGAASSPGGYGGPRSTPATDGTLVYALCQEGELVAADLSGAVRWQKNLSRDFGGRMMSGWGYSESPLLDGKLVLVTPGGSKGTVLALDRGGQTVWQCPDLKDSAAYASLVPADIGGIRQYIVFTDSSVAGVAQMNGRMAWRVDRKGATAVIPTPVYGDGIVFVTSGYGIGCNGIRVTGAGGRFTAQEIYQGKQLTTHHGGVVLIGGFVYGMDDGQLKCLDLKTGKEMWANRCVGKGSITYADGNLICRSEGGPVALVEASPAGYKERGRFNQPDRSDKNSWPYPVVFGGKLYLRDQDTLFCYSLK